MSKAATWTRIKKELTGYDSSDLLEVIKSLYDLSKQNQAFLMGLVDREASLEALKAPVIKAIAKAFNPPRGFPSFKPAEAKRAVHQFTKLAPAQDTLVPCGLSSPPISASLQSVPNSSDMSLLATRSAREMLTYFCHFPLEMMLHFVQNGIWATTTYGDIDETFSISLKEMWENALEVVLQVRKPQAELPRLKTILKTAQDFGWGFTDQMNDLFALFMEKLEMEKLEAAS